MINQYIYNYLCFFSFYKRSNSKSVGRVESRDVKTTKPDKKGKILRHKLKNLFKIKFMTLS